MKTLRWIVGGILVCLVLVLVALQIVGWEPRGAYPGAWLKGTVEPTPTDWTFVLHSTDGLHEASGNPLVLIQTREHLLPLLAYSVTTSCVVMDKNLYVGAEYVSGVRYPDGRHWNKNLIRDPRVRIKIVNRLFSQALVPVTDPAMARALEKEWERRRPHAADPGMYKLWFHVVPENDPRATAGLDFGRKS